MYASGFLYLRFLFHFGLSMIKMITPSVADRIPKITPSIPKKVEITPQITKTYKDFIL